MKLVRCKICGLIIPENQLGDKCPACGVPRSNFQPYTDPVAAHRRRTLSLHLHPIAVHFPTSFAIAVLLLGIAALLLHGDAFEIVRSTMEVLGVLLPVVVLGAALLGILDGIVRFRHIGRSQMLKRKIIYGSVFLAVSIPIAILVWLDSSIAQVFIVILSLITAVCAIQLGLIGMRLDDNALPGK
jgi:uncharacterized membrane protein